MVYFLWVITIPIAIVWTNGPRIIGAIVPDQATADLAGRYLQVLVIGTPGYAAFEAGKRFVQAQGKFSATLIVLLVCAPLNVFLHWLFVWVRIKMPNAHFITDGILEIPMGIHRSSYCCGDHREPDATVPVPLRSFCWRLRVLGRIYSSRFQKLDADD